MPTIWIILLLILLVIVLFAAAFMIYFVSSPMPVVKRLRKGMDGPIKYPVGGERLKEELDIKKDLVYPSAHGKNRFDLYLPKRNGRFPLILWVHGGAFVAGDKSGIESWGVTLAEKGYAVAVMNYEWAPEAAYPAQLIQIVEALREVGKIAQTTGKIDMSRVAIAGDSAGAHMAAQFALLHTNPDFSKRLGTGSPLEKGALKCALLYCGPYNLQKMFSIENKALKLIIGRIGWSYLGQKNWRKSDLVDTLTISDFVTKDYVSSYITDGNTFSFESHGIELGKKLRALGVPVSERYFDKEKYGDVHHEYQMDLTQKNALDCLEDTLKFLSDTM